MGLGCHPKLQVDIAGDVQLEHGVRCCIGDPSTAFTPLHLQFVSSESR